MRVVEGTGLRFSKSTSPQQMEGAAAEALLKANGQYQGAAVAGGALVLVAALYLLAEKYTTTRRVQQHWEEVCRLTLQRRDSLEHRILRSDGDTNKVRIKDPGGHLVWCDAPPMVCAGVVAAPLVEGVRNMLVRSVCGKML